MSTVIESTEVEVQQDEFMEHVEAAGAFIGYTSGGLHYYFVDFIGKEVLFGTLNPETEMGILQML